MASRQLAAVATRTRRLPGGLRASCWRRRAAGHPALARRGVRPALRRLLGLAPTSTPRPRPFLDLIADARRPGRRHQGLAARRRPRDRRCAPRLPAGVRLYTGDDFHYPELIRGRRRRTTPTRCSASSPPSRRPPPRPCSALDAGDAAPPTTRRSRPTVPLARHLFAAPTYYYKTGIAFLAWLNGHQPGFTMVGGLQRARSAVAPGARSSASPTTAGVLPDPELAAHRLPPARRRRGLAR